MKILKSDKRTEIYNDFSPLLKKMDQFHQDFMKEWELSPFSLTEQTIVGAFAWSAGALGLNCLNEYQVLKSKKPGKKPKANGRADFWIDFGLRNYSLEFKRAKEMANLKNLRQKFDLAKSDISKVDSEEHLRACAVLSAFAPNNNKKDIYEKFGEENDVDLAVRLGKSSNDCVYLYFSVLGA